MLAFVFFHVADHFKYTLAEILDWYPLAEALGIQQATPTLADGSYQTTLVLDPGGAILMCDGPPVVDLDLCT